MTIENERAYLNSIWNWKFLRPSFPRGIEPGDIDGFVEVGGYFLILEGKAPGVPLKDAQVKWFRRMLRWNEKIPGLFTMIVLWGHAPSRRVDRLQFWPTAPFESNRDSLVSYVSAWAESAEERAAIQDESDLAETRALVESALRVAVPSNSGRPVTAADIKW